MQKTFLRSRFDIFDGEVQSQTYRVRIKALGDAERSLIHRPSSLSITALV